MEQLFQMALENGIIAALFTGLLIYVIRDSATREKKYQTLIAELSESLKIVKQIHKDVTEIKKANQEKQP
jgi:hypothetical protein